MVDSALSVLDAAVLKAFDHPATVFWRTRELECVKNVLQRYTIEEPLLDLGCAEGKIARIVFEGKKLIGIDNCPELISGNRQSETYRGLILADARVMPFKDQSLNCVFSNSVIEHIPGIERLLSEVSRILRPGGLFIFTVPSARLSEYLSVSCARKGLSFLGKVYARARNRQLNHFNLHNHGTWQEMLKKNGLGIVEHRYYLALDDIVAWDTMCLGLRLSGFIPLLRRKLEKRYFKHSRTLLDKREVLDSGAGLLVIARHE